MKENCKKNKKNPPQMTLSVAPPLDAYPVTSDLGQPRLGIGGAVQSWNASLALQLTECWRKWREGEKGRTFSGRFFAPPTPQNRPSSPAEPGPFPLDRIHLSALSRTRWVGRCSIVDRSASVRLHLDGAHTPESVSFCARWFHGVAGRPRILVFNVLGERDARCLLQELKVRRFSLFPFPPQETQPCPRVLLAVRIQ